MLEPNLVHSGLSQEINENGRLLRVEIYRLEHDPDWTLEVVNEDGTSTVWDDLFKTDQKALDEVFRTIRDEGTSVFYDDENVVPFRK